MRHHHSGVGALNFQANAFATQMDSSDNRPLFSITTPSFRGSQWLTLCVASVAEQEGVSVEHIVQDAGSDDGTLDWLTKDHRVRAFVEKDEGMYDAINRGWKRSRGEYLAYLNCDEQYLPGVLKKVARVFAEHPDVDLVSGDMIVIGPDGGYRFHRKMLTPTLYHTWVCHLATFTCTIFVRRSFIEKHSLYFNPRFRVVGDGEWMVRVLQKKPRCLALREFVSAFGDTGANLTNTPNALREENELRASAPAWVRTLRPLWVGAHRIRRWAGGVYSQSPFAYEVFTTGSSQKRQRFEVSEPRFRWAIGTQHEDKS